MNNEWYVITSKEKHTDKTVLPDDYLKFLNKYGYPLLIYADKKIAEEVAKTNGYKMVIVKPKE